MRRALIITAVLFSFSALDARRAKGLVRRLVVKLCRLVLKFVSSPYRLDDGVTLVIAPHQDDETLGCGGLIARKRNEGLPVHVVFLTDGSASHPNHPKFTADAIAALRNQEARKSLSILGVESCAIHFLNEPDGTLSTLSTERHTALVQQLKRLIIEINPHKILLPVHGDGSSEHEAAFQFVISAVKCSGLSCELWQYAVWAWWNPILLLRLVFLQPHRHRLPLEDYKLVKERALANYCSQTEPLAPWTEATLPAELLNQFRGDAEYFFQYRSPRTAAPTASASLSI